MTCTFIYGQKYWHPFLEEKRHFQTVQQKINVLKMVFPPLLQQFEVYEMTAPIWKSLVCDEFWLI